MGPTSMPTAAPTQMPTAGPTAMPTATPTAAPTPSPTQAPTPEYFYSTCFMQDIYEGRVPCEISTDIFRTALSFRYNGEDFCINLDTGAADVLVRGLRGDVKFSCGDGQYVYEVRNIIKPPGHERQHLGFDEWLPT